MYKIPRETTNRFQRLGEIAKKKAEAARAKVGTGIKNAFSSAGSRFHRSEKIGASPEAVESNIDSEGLEKPKIEEGSPISEPQECEQISSDNDTLGNSVPSEKDSVSLEVATECLTCESLVHCEFRNNPSLESIDQCPNRVSCPLAKRLSGE